MPLILISGCPSSGKTRRANELKDFFETKDKTVKIISENAAIAKAGFDKNEYFSNSQLEKMVRSDLKSEVIRLLNKSDVIILDAGNYIKGFRYELFCASKAVRSTQCTLFCGIQKEKAWEFNNNRREDAYTQNIFEALFARFEEPHGNCRWDSPLFVTFPPDELNFDGIYNALFESRPLPPNFSTQNPPLNATNYLFELDKLTQNIVNDIISARKIEMSGPLLIKGSHIKVDIPDDINVIQLNRIRRQFLNYSKLHSTSGSLDKIPQIFVQFLNSNAK